MIKKSIFVLSICLLAVAGSAWAQGLPDTGQTKCYNNTAEIPCPAPGEPFYGQDAQFSCNPHSYTDLGNGIVRDNVTGLEWQKETFYGRLGYSQAHDYITSLNNQSYLGYNDWRLPNVKELSSLIDSGQHNPSIDTIFSSNTEPRSYWTSTIYAKDAGFAWVVSFGDGSVGITKTLDDDVDWKNCVRAVRGNQYYTSNNFVINGDGTITDTTTGLMWLECNYGQCWGGPGYSTELNWQQALEYAQRLNSINHLGYNDWRLPSKNELQSLVNYDLHDPATTFPNTMPYYWSSTTYTAEIFSAHDIYFPTGGMGSYEKNYSSSYMRAVRGGLCQSSGDECKKDNDCDDNLYCNGAEECIDGNCKPGIEPCDESEICNESTDQCFTEDCDQEWDLNGDCTVNKADDTILKTQQKDEKTALSNRHKAEKAAMKAAIGSSGDCEEELDLNGDCGVDKDDSNLLKLRQKDEKNTLKLQHTTEKAEMKAAL